MADRYTTVTTDDIRDSAVTEAELNASVAGDGISGGGGTPLALDINELTGVAVDVANDLLAIEDATDSSTKKESIADIVTAIAGDGLSATSGVLALDLNELTQAVVDVSADFVAIEDATDNSTKKESIADIVTAIAGTGLASASGVLSLDLNELSTEATFDPSADYLGIVDATDNGSDKTLWSVIATAIAGSGITATNGVLSVDSIANNVVESDFATDDFTSQLDGATADFTLTDIPISASLKVFINGKYAIEGTGKDYELNPDSGQTKTIRIAGANLESTDRLVAVYVKDN